MRFSSTCVASKSLQKATIPISRPHQGVEPGVVRRRIGFPRVEMRSLGASERTDACLHIRNRSEEIRLRAAHELSNYVRAVPARYGASVLTPATLI